VLAEDSYMHVSYPFCFNLNRILRRLMLWIVMMFHAMKLRRFAFVFSPYYYSLLEFELGVIMVYDSFW